MNLHVVILAAGNGKRMCSAVPKVMHHLAGKPILGHVIDTAKQLNPARVHVVHGNHGSHFSEYFPEHDLHWVLQAEQLGTANAVAQALPHIEDNDRILILYGDVPLTPAETLQSLLTAAPEEGIGLLIADFWDPTGLGRIIRNEKGDIIAIVEQRDATPEQLAIREINTGILTAPAKLFKKWLPNVHNNNQQQEFYLTDIIAIAVKEQHPVAGVSVGENWWSVQGINDRVQLESLERIYQDHLARKIMAQGVSIADINRFDLRGNLQSGQDVSIDINVVLEGNIVLGNNVRIEQNCLLRNVRIGDHVVIKANSVIEDSVIENHCQVGPFARLRPGTHLQPEVHVGNFVEIKNSQLGMGTKAGHLSYLGDATIGEQVNIGAGTITCNYDGKNKHKTLIDHHAFIGSNTALVAPITIGAHAVIGAGSTLSKEAPAEELTLSRAPQKTIFGWKKKRQQNDLS